MQAVEIAVVQRCRRDADRVGFAPVADNAMRAEVIEQGATRDASVHDAQRELAAAATRIARGGDVDDAGEMLANQRIEKASQGNGFFAQASEPGGPRTLWEPR